MVGKMMMATKASGDPRAPNARDISRDLPDLMHVDGEDGDYWVGHWIEGMGFINVYFPKATTRPCTDEEKVQYLQCRFDVPGIGSVRFKAEDFA